MRRSLGAIRLLCAFLLAALLVPAGVSARPKEEPPPKPPVVKEGKVQAVRGIRRREAQLTDSTGKRWLLVGPLRSELLRLHGHRLRAFGDATPSKDAAKLATFKVVRYELADVSGRQPQVGRLARHGSALTLVQKERTLNVVAKRAMAARLRRLSSCKVWLLGDIEKNSIKVFKYGRITCEKPSPIKAKKEKSR